MLTDTEIAVIFTTNLKQLMREHGMNQKDLSKAIGVGQATITDWMKLRYIPRTDVLSKLCRLFNCSVADLLTDKKSSPTLSDEARREEVIRMLMDLTPEEVEDVLGYIAFRKAMRKDPSASQE